MQSDIKVTFDGYKNKMKNRIYALLCEKEKDGEWEKFLDTILIEIQGLKGQSINWWMLIGKLNSLRFLSFDYFRKTIFDCMNLVGNLELPDGLS